MKAVGAATSRRRGQSAVEFAIVLPFIALLVFGVIETSLTGIRGIVAQHAVFRAARVAAVYQGRYVGDELSAELPSVLFRGGAVQSAADAGNRTSIRAFARPLFDLTLLRPAVVLARRSPVAAALPPGLSDAILRGGDTPSPYCAEDGSYAVCGY